MYICIQGNEDMFYLSERERVGGGGWREGDKGGRQGKRERKSHRERERERERENM